MEKMHAKRLLKLAALLDTVPREEFDLGSWRTERRCGTTACACGWAATIPSFKRAGLSLKLDGVDDYDGSTDYSFVFSPVSAKEKETCKSRWREELKSIGGRLPRKYEDIDAAMLFFGITRDEAFSLFIPGSYYTEREGIRTPPKTVAKTIRLLVKQRHPELAAA